MISSRSHPLDPGTSYFFSEFLTYAKQQYPKSPHLAQIDIAIKLWAESDPELKSLPDFGDWTYSGEDQGAFPHQLTGMIPSIWGENNKTMVQRSYSCGALAEGGKPTGRHEFGHPTAVGSSWIAAL